MLFTCGCGDDEPNRGAQGGSSGEDSGGGGPSGGFVGYGGTGGGGHTVPCPDVSLGGAGASSGPDGAACSGKDAYCLTEDARTCACWRGEWFCFGGVDPIVSTESVLTGAYRGRDNQACLKCAEAYCATSEQWTCEAAGTGSACRHLLACQLESGCPRAEGGVESCYCGSAASDSDCLYTSAADGVCLRDEAVSLTTPVTVLTHYFSSTPSHGPANILARCLAENCASCFENHDQNACPAVSALAVERSALIGSTVSLRALASDPDRAPGKLSYAWSVTPTGAGVLEDSTAATTEWRCVSPGRVTIKLRVSDGDVGCDWESSTTVQCGAPECYADPLLSSARAAFVGESISLTVLPRDPTGLVVEWTSSSNATGSLSAQGLVATYTCARAGIATITASTSQGSCRFAQPVGITCTERDTGATEPDTTESALRRSYLGRNNEACWACALEGSCLNSSATLPCEYRTDPAERALCLRLLACELESGCVKSVATCYCATTDGCFASSQRSAAGGSCRVQLEDALQTRDPSFVSSHFVDFTLPGAQASILAQCLIERNCESCFPPTYP